MAFEKSIKWPESRKPLMRQPYERRSKTYHYGGEHLSRNQPLAHLHHDIYLMKCLASFHIYSKYARPISVARYRRSGEAMADGVMARLRSYFDLAYDESEAALKIY